MKSISRKLLLFTLVAVAFLSACNKPTDPTMDVKVMGSWYLTDLLVNEQVVADYSNEFVLDLEVNSTVIFVNHDGIGLTGSWTIDAAGTSLTLTSDLPDAEPITFEVLYMLTDKLGLRRTVSSALLGDQTFTYILER